MVWKRYPSSKTKGNWSRIDAPQCILLVYGIYFLFIELKPYDPVDPKMEQWSLQSTYCVKERKAGISEVERKERNIIHVLYGHSTKH